jgi:hypothetical protein
MIFSHSRGHKIIFINNKWVYEDNKKPIDNKRPCKRCGKAPTSQGHDACLGHIDGMSSACCGHGVEDPYFKEIGEKQ